eukprot:GHVN01013873.1.p1 GENE.GHVN01013873.1~~GHVN01013873.1.p1  ORF type:complete len:198 (+),score=15.52 GHVN01013873.1:69-596(+)
MLDALHAFFPTEGEGALGALDWPKEVRKKIASESLVWTCAVCQRSNADIAETNCPVIREKRPALPEYVEHVPRAPHSKVNESVPAPKAEDATAAPNIESTPSSERNNTQENINGKHFPTHVPNSGEPGNDISARRRSRIFADRSKTNIVLVMLDVFMLVLATVIVLLVGQLFVAS